MSGILSELKILGDRIIQAVASIEAKTLIPETFFSDLEQFDTLLGQFISMKNSDSSDIEKAHNLNAHVLSHLSVIKDQLSAQKSAFIKKKGGLNKYLEVSRQR